VDGDDDDDRDDDDATTKRPSSSSLSLSLRTTPQKKDGAAVSGAERVEVRTLDDVLDVLHYGARNRSVRSTEANERSSRSHTIFEVTARSNGRLRLVDLAGSEKWRYRRFMSKTKVRELTAINGSLTALGKCVAALAARRPHVPYRESKLTRLPQDALATDNATFLVTLSPAPDALDDTLGTLDFAKRAMRVPAVASRDNTVVVNDDDDDDDKGPSSSPERKLRRRAKHVPPPLDDDDNNDEEPDARSVAVGRLRAALEKARRRIRTLERELSRRSPLESRVAVLEKSLGDRADELKRERDAAVAAATAAKAHVRRLQKAAKAAAAAEDAARSDARKTKTCQRRRRSPPSSSSARRPLLLGGAAPHDDDDDDAVEHFMKDGILRNEEDTWTPTWLP